ncbi:MAG: SRPBCC family protein [Planctomycetota bacterium]
MAFQFSVEKHIHSDPATVFARATDVAQWPAMIPGIIKTEVLTDGPVGEGTRFRETRKMFGKEASEEMTFSAFEPGARYCLLCENHGARYEFEYLVSPDGDGTKLEMRGNIEATSTVAKVMMTLMKPMQKKFVQQCTADLDHLKASIEGAHAGGA